MKLGACISCDLALILGRHLPHSLDRLRLLAANRLSGTDACRDHNARATKGAFFGQGWYEVGLLHHRNVEVPLRTTRFHTNLFTPIKINKECPRAAAEGP